MALMTELAAVQAPLGESKRERRIKLSGPWKKSQMEKLDPVRYPVTPNAEFCTIDVGLGPLEVGVEPFGDVLEPPDDDPPPPDDPPPDEPPPDEAPDGVPDKDVDVAAFRLPKTAPRTTARMTRTRPTTPPIITDLRRHHLGLAACPAWPACDSWASCACWWKRA